MFSSKSVTDERVRKEAGLFEQMNTFVDSKVGNSVINLTTKDKRITDNDNENIESNESSTVENDDLLSLAIKSAAVAALRIEEEIYLKIK